MSIIAVSCRLVAPATTRQPLWQLMAEHNTPFITELFQRISQHPDFDQWLQDGKPNAKTFKAIWQKYRDEFPPKHQPGRFYSSALFITQYTYAAWFKLQKRRSQILSGKQHWLNTIKSDPELLTHANCDYQTLHDRATEILTQLTSQTPPSASRPTRPKSTKPKSDQQATSKHLLSELFKAHASATEPLTQAAIIYLIKHHGTIKPTLETPEAYQQTIHKKQKQIEQLQQELISRRPKGRDLTGETFLQALDIATTQIPSDNAEWKLWQAALMRRPAKLPYPLLFGSNGDLRWFTNDRGRICVQFNGFSQHTFQIYCDQRQLPYFQRFLQDWENHKQHGTSLSLCALRTAQVIWQESDPSGDPWQANHLRLTCFLDTRLMNAAGTDAIRQQKQETAQQNIASIQAKAELTPQQATHLKRQQSLLQKLQQEPIAPICHTHQRRSNILIGVSIGLEAPATVAIVDVTIGNVITYRSIKQLLGKDYKLVQRRRQEQQHQTQQRKQAQKRGILSTHGNAELGQHLDRLIAKAIINLAQHYNASSIVLPNLNRRRDLLAAEIKARAEAKCPDYKEGQDHYARAYRQSIHNWSYQRLADSIQGSAAKHEIPVEIAYQPLQGNAQEKARDLAIAAYHHRRTA
jgi:hypothetical protein